MKHYLAALFVAVQTATLSTSVMSAAGVVEAQPYLPGQTPQGGQLGSTSSNDALVMLLDQFRLRKQKPVSCSQCKLQLPNLNTLRLCLVYTQQRRLL